MNAEHREVIEARLRAAGFERTEDKPVYSSCECPHGHLFTVVPVEDRAIYCPICCCIVRVEGFQHERQ